MRLTIVSDAWYPQINGVVRTLDQTIQNLRDRGHVVTLLHPGLFRTVALPGYREIRLSVDLWKLGAMIEESRPDALHITVEGTLGVAAKCWADRRSLPYTTSYHTRFPEYIQSRLGFGLNVGQAFMRWFHRYSQGVMVNTPTMISNLTQTGIQNLVSWGRGVDTEMFTPDGDTDPIMRDLPRPILLNVGRVSIEKNLPDFYALDSIGTLVQVGDGPLLRHYQNEFPHVHFLGSRSGKELAACYRTADVLVFPSRSDTFGLVMLEAMASGIPVAGYPVTGPIDIVRVGIDGELHPLLSMAVKAALALNDRQAIRESAQRFSWAVCTDQFEANLARLTLA